VYAEAGAWLLEADGPQVVVAVNNPPGWYYFTGLPSLVIPNGSTDTLLEAMASGQARWLVLDVDRPAGLADLYAAPQTTEPRLSLRATFADQSGRPVYVMETAGTP
jgi:hypothetical protein